MCVIGNQCQVYLNIRQNNVLLDADYTARLADFGYASLVGNIPEALTYLQRSTARPGALRWNAPEQVDPEETFKPTTKSDIYSFGCVALQGSSLDSDGPAYADILSGFVGKTTMVGSPARRGRRLTLGKGPQTGQTRVSSNGRLALEFNSRLLVTDGRAPYCGGDNTHHSTILELLPAVPSPL